MNSLNREHLLEHFAERLQRGGVTHPTVAAAVLAARGAAGVDHIGFARQIGVRVADLRLAESGQVAAVDLSPRLREAIILETKESTNHALHAD